MKAKEKLLLPHLGWARPYNAAGINTHFWVEVSESDAVSVCGRTALIDDLKTRGEIFSSCSTCMAILEKCANSSATLP